jgi:DNA-binding transcriptional MocR family regulator
VLTERADALDAALKAEGLPGAPWQGGFFVTIEVPDEATDGAAPGSIAGTEAMKVCERLQALGVFVVPIPEGLRVGVCGLKTSDAPRFAAALKAALAG